MTWLDELTSVARITSEALLNGLWQGVLLCACVGVALAFARRTNAATRYAVWWITLVAVAALPLMRTAPAQRRVATARMTIVEEPVRSIARTASGILVRPVARPRVATLPGGSPAVARAPRTVASAPALSIPSTIATVHVRNSWPLALFCAWLAGAGLMLARLAWSCLHVRNLRRDATPLDARYQNRLREWLAASGGPRHVGLCAVESISTPMSLGPIDPLILMPAGLAGFLSDAEFDQVLLHELAHVRRGDNWTNLIQKFIEALLFFHPAVWCAARFLNLERETACDDWVVDTTGAAKPYAACLARLVEVTTPLPQPVLATGMLRGARQISTRIERLLDRRRNKTPRVSHLVLAPVLLVLLAAVLAGSQARAVLAGPVIHAPLARFQPVAWAGAAQTATPRTKEPPRAVRPKTSELQTEIEAAETPGPDDTPVALEDDAETTPEPDIAEQLHALKAQLESTPAPDAAEQLRALEQQIEVMQTPEAEERFRALQKELEGLRSADADAQLRAAQDQLLEAQRSNSDLRQWSRSKNLKALGNQLLAAEDALRHVTEWNFQQSNGWWNGLNVHTSGQIEFTDDDADVKSVSPGGYLRIEERRGWTTHKYEVTSSERRYLVNGHSQPIDNDARAWLAEVLPHVIRDSAVGADARVKRILKQRGPSGVLDEIAKISSDRAKCIYFEELFGNGPVAPETLSRAARQIGREVASDGEKARLLTSLADTYLKDSSARADYFDAIGTIASDGEHRRVLSAVVQKDGRNKDTLLLTLKSSARISSDGEKARVLTEAADAPAFDDSVSAEFLHAVNTISSDGEHARVLMALMRSSSPSKDTLLLAMNSAGRIASDGEKSRVLVRASEFYSSDAAVRAAFFHATATIASDGEHGRVLSALLAKSGLDKESFIEIIHSAAHIASDGEKGRVLRQVAALCPGDDAMVAALMQAVETIGSDGEYRRVMSAMMARADLGAKLGKIKYI